MGGQAVGKNVTVPNLAGAQQYALTPANNPVPTIGHDGRPGFTFAAGSSQRLSNTAASALSALPITMACWARPTDNAITSSLIYLGNTANTDKQIGLDISGTEANDPLRAWSGTTSSKANNPTFGKWSHFAGVFSSTSSWTAHINAVAGTTATSGGSNGVGNTRLDVGSLFRSDFASGVNFHTGDIGEIQIYNVAVAQSILARLADPATAYELWYPLRSRKWIWMPLPATSGQTVSIAQVTETDTAQALTAVPGAKTTAVNQVVEDETAQALAVAATKTQAITQVQETETAQAFSVVAAHTVAIAQVQENETAQPLTVAASKIQAIAQTVETETAQTLLAQQPGSFSGVVELDTAQSLTVATSVTAAIGQVVESATAQSLTPVLQTTLGITLALEIDAAQALTPIANQSASIAQVVETETAQSLTVVAPGGGAAAADVWNYVLYNGKTAEETLVEAHSMLTTLTAILGSDIAPGINALQGLRIILAAVSGPTTGVGTNTERYYSPDGLTERIAATFDANGNRSSVTLNP